MQFCTRGRGLVRHGDGLQRSLRMMNNGSTDKLMMTRWSTDAISAHSHVGETRRS